MIKAEIVADSICQGKRITSFILTYPRFIHSEALTHRMFSKNCASSRAIPVKKVIEDIRANPAMPIHWSKNKSGMQADGEIERKDYAKIIWLKAMESAIDHANSLMDLGIHKQVANRLLEPFFHMKTLLTGTDFDNFFALRFHKDADPNFQALAGAMLHEYCTHKPKKLEVGEWHLPFSDRFMDGLTLEQKLKVATARAARTSYLTFDGCIDYQKDYDLHDMLLASGHLSPFEHTAQASGEFEYFGNFMFWKQYRKTFPQSKESRIFDYDQYCKEQGLPAMDWV